MDDETHAAIDLAVEGDEQLLREALEALKAIDDGWVPTTVSDNEMSMIARRARATITKLEERLLET